MITNFGRASRGLGRIGVAALLTFAANACALLGKGEALTPRYFSPDSASGRMSSSPSPIDASAPPSDSAGMNVELRLGRVSAASYLGERIVFRDSNYELNFYEERRWTEKPGAYLRRALSQSLFEEHGVRRIMSGPGPTLEVELTEFAELRETPPLARVRATYILYDQRLVRREATVTVQLPITKAAGMSQPESPEPAVRAMTDALHGIVERIVAQVLAELRTPEPNSAAQTPQP